jgi:hypothetical protein
MNEVISSPVFTFAVVLVAAAMLAGAIELWRRMGTGG